MAALLFAGAIHTLTMLTSIFVLFVLAALLIILCDLPSVISYMIILVFFNGLNELKVVLDHKGDDPQGNFLSNVAVNGQPDETRCTQPI